ncbi:retrotransposon protein, putative, Ty1-copia subclass [Cucumis melo var. makuwa]|uniref:Retrotransposon protein, putative, Ty1-copia subclass n=1 Tax=Cucumis melo var. makuwa TaxID=1194695 RepID=A0A5D3D5W5_CUCMM|nr:retrotransposon protein, putative, Ty1-copia subclass [Cucumis melo var. makuwa]
MEDQTGEEEEIVINHNAKSVQILDIVLIAASFDILQDQIHQMSAMVATPDLNIDSNWYTDSGATNHLTHSLSNLSTGSEYGGGNQIYAANGSGSGYWPSTSSRTT